MLVRAGGLAETMSRYLIRRIEENPAIDAAHPHRDRRPRRARTHLERVRWRDNRTGAVESAPSATSS